MEPIVLLWLRFFVLSEAFLGTAHIFLTWTHPKGE
ncbi:MAG: hypothetical protein K0S39_4466 [Paenibacillus sp.]|jgi:hypothetical protein|nr:hypothetical protein [Paenibacillus sp.]